VHPKAKSTKCALPEAYKDAVLDAVKKHGLNWNLIKTEVETTRMSIEWRKRSHIKSAKVRSSISRFD
jgi:hypothetical protein